MDEIAALKKLAGIGKSIQQDFYDGSNCSLTGNEKAKLMREHNIKPGTPEWFKLWFAKPKLTGEKPINENRALVVSDNSSQAKVQIVKDPQSLEQGLQGRTDLADDEGMLFVFEKSGIQCMWMKDTPTPLSAAFISNDGTILKLVDMEPNTTDKYCSEGPVKYVLEMKQGWFEKQGLRTGDKLKVKKESK